MARRLPTKIDCESAFGSRFIQKMTSNDAIDFLSKKNVHERDARIQFLEGPHLYVVDGSSQGYVSVTTLNHGYFKTFNSTASVDTILANPKYLTDPTYKYYGMSREDILNSWSSAGKIASQAGTLMHLDIEKYYNEMPVENVSPEFQLFKNFVGDFPHLQAFRTEWCVFYEEAKIAGSIDMVFFNTLTGMYEIYDWKRVKEISMNAFRSDDVGLVPPLADMPNSNYWHYSLQLNIYQYILQKKYGMKIANRCLIVLHPENVYKRYLRYELPDLQEIVEQLFDLRVQDVAAAAASAASAASAAPEKKTRSRKKKGI
jgi:hypothetical protein